MFLLFFFVVASIAKEASKTHNPSSTDFVIENKSGRSLMMYWKQPGSGNLIPQWTSPMVHTGTQVTNSYTTHEFVINEQGVLESNENNSFIVKDLYAYITATTDEYGNIRVTYEDEIDRKMSAFETEMNTCSTETCVSDPVKGDVLQCIGDHVKGQYHDLSMKLKQTMALRKRLSSQMRDYICADLSLKTTPAHTTGHWRYNGKMYSYRNIFKQMQVQIKLIDNFISTEECDQLIKRGSPRLIKAGVAGSNGKSEYSQARKAKSASVEPKRGSKEKDILADLQDRILAFTNEVTGYDLHIEGQEGFSVIKYDANGDEYTQHCDGACDGTIHKAGGRVATMVLYCKVAEKGGQTTFTNADVVVVPKQGQASFFSYMGEDRVMDEAELSKHSGCPIIEGEKWIATMWMRDGVDSVNNWETFSPQGTRNNRFKDQLI